MRYCFVAECTLVDDCIEIGVTITNTKGAWVSDRALLIQLFLSLDRKKSSWNKLVHGWASIERELIRRS